MTEDQHTGPSSREKISVGESLHFNLFTTPHSTNKDWIYFTTLLKTST